MTQQPDPIFELIRRWRQARANFKGARRRPLRFVGSPYLSPPTADRRSCGREPYSGDLHAHSLQGRKNSPAANSYSFVSLPDSLMRGHDAASMRVFGPGDQAAPANTEQLITEGAELQHLRSERVVGVARLVSFTH